MLLGVILILLVVIIIVLSKWGNRIEHQYREYKNMKRSGPEGEYGMETGEDEFWKSMMGELAINMKRTYDAYQAVSLEQLHDLHAHNMKVMSDAQAQTVTTRGYENQATQNAITTADMVAKRALGLFDRQDVAFNKFTNLDAEEAASQNMVLSAVEIEAIKASIVDMVNQAINKAASTKKK